LEQAQESVIRRLAAVIFALALIGCGKVSDSTDSSVPAGFLGAAEQFLELGDHPPSASFAPTSAFVENVGAVEATSQFFELGSSAPKPGLARSAGGRAGRNTVAADLNGITEQIRNLYGDASAFVEGFPQAEDQFRNVPTRYRGQVEKINSGRNPLPPDVIQRRIADLSRLAIEAIDHVHERYETLHVTFDQRYNDIVNRSGALEQSCAKLPPGADPDSAQACTRFLDAESMLKTKGPLVDGGFDHIEQVYKEIKQYQTNLNEETLDGK
jgi:hypothetical protein